VHPSPMVGTTNKSIVENARRMIAHKRAPDSTRLGLMSHGSVAGRPHVVIVGAGFGGLTAAKGLAKAAVEVTLIDRENHHLFQPLLYQVATAGLSPAEIAWPIRGLVRGQRNTRVLLGEVTGVERALERRPARARVRRRQSLGNEYEHWWGTFRGIDAAASLKHMFCDGARIASMTFPRHRCCGLIEATIICSPPGSA
jgi:choline dehydrogenase-like flavoprotein